MINSSVPFVVEKNSDGDRVYDIYSRLLEDRIIFLGEEVTRCLSNSIVAQLLLLDQKDKGRDVCLYINSPGGSIEAGMAIYDTMNYIRPDVRTVCIGEASSMGAFLLSSGAKGKRCSLPNSEIMIHQPRSVSGADVTMTVTEQEIDLKRIKRMKKHLTEILAINTGKTYKQVLKDCEMDKWFTANEAKDYGLIDEIIDKKQL